MYKILGFRTVAVWFAILAIMIAFAWYFLSPPATWSRWWPLISGSAASAGTIFAVLGETPLFPWLCRRTPLGRVFPPISGTWTGTIHSNWSTIAERSRHELQGDGSLTKPIHVQVRIFTKLSSVRVNLESADGYTSSKTVLVGVGRDPDDGEVRLTYVYRASTLRPVPGDADSHHGAGYVDLKEEAGEPARLVGVYWTNRNWHEGLNTAGEIRLHQQS